MSILNHYFHNNYIICFVAIKLKMQYELGEYNDMVRILGAQGMNEGRAAQEYRRLYENHRDRLPDRNVFVRLRDSMRADVVLLPPRRANAGRQRLRNDEEILENMNANPTTSTRRAGFHFQTAHSTVFRVFREDIQHPFHNRTVQNLHDVDYDRRVLYAEWFNDRYDEEPDDFYRSILYTDESPFTQDPCVNTHNDHVWAHENPHCVVATHRQNRFKINVWAGLSMNLLYVQPSNRLIRCNRCAC